MCGICGLWNLKNAPIDIGLLISMRDIMSHRGPDGKGSALFSTNLSARPITFQEQDELISVRPQLPMYNVGLGHRRLAIIDLSTGDQPMTNEDGSVWIVFNGEIYNYRELREELKGYGHVFKTASDTEVILHAYEEWKDNCPAKLNGIFGFAIWDGHDGSLFLARDHFGVKPLYYCLHEDCFYFASELKAILCNSAIPRQVDLDALNLCLIFRYIPSPKTLLKGICRLPPGCFIHVTSQGIKEGRYWQDAPDIKHEIKEKDWIEQLQFAVERAIIRQMMSDVPIGISLSSGVDSTTVLALMSQHSNDAVLAFTVGFAGREAQSEIEPARKMANRFGARFHEQVITSSDYANFMERYLWHLEEPIGNESAAAYYFVAEMARQQGVKVLLNGQGADEAFAGYKRYFGVMHKRWLRLATIFPARYILPRLFASKPIGERYQRFLFAIDAGEEDERFLRVHSILTESMKRSLINPDLMELINSELPRQYIRDQLNRTHNGTALEKMTYVDARTSLPDNLLLCEDKMAMAASIEARVPFLDLDLMAIAESIPERFKLRRERDKYIHRKACIRWVGQEVTSRPQIGFDNAVDIWLRSELGSRMRDVVTASDSFTNNYLNQNYVLKLMEEHSNKKRDHQRILFLLFSIESWYHIFNR